MWKWWIGKIFVWDNLIFGTNFRFPNNDVTKRTDSGEPTSLWGQSLYSGWVQRGISISGPSRFRRRMSSLVFSSESKKQPARERERAVSLFPGFLLGDFTQKLNLLFIKHCHRKSVWRTKFHGVFIFDSFINSSLFTTNCNYTFINDIADWYVDVDVWLTNWRTKAPGCSSYVWHCPPSPWSRPTACPPLRTDSCTARTCCRRIDWGCRRQSRGCCRSWGAPCCPPWWGRPGGPWCWSLCSNYLGTETLRRPELGPDLLKHSRVVNLINQLGWKIVRQMQRSEKRKTN